VPVIDGHLARDDGGSLLIAVLDDLQEIAALPVTKLLRPQSSRMSRSIFIAIAYKNCRI
jgi:hypothetical protein